MLSRRDAADMPDAAAYALLAYGPISFAASSARLRELSCGDRRQSALRLRCRSRASARASAVVRDTFYASPPLRRSGARERSVCARAIRARALCARRGGSRVFVL